MLVTVFVKQPWGDIAVSVTACTPADVNVKAGFTLLERLPLPKFQVYDEIV